MGRRSKQPAKKQQPITLHALPLLKKPLEQIGKQINVPGSYWEGRMSADERSTLYKSAPCVTSRRCTGSCLPLCRLARSALAHLLAHVNARLFTSGHAH